MNQTTKTAITAIIAADASIPKEAAQRALSILAGNEAPRPVGRVLRTTEVAKLCGVTTKTLRLWAANGILVPVFGPGRKLRTGYTEESVRAIIEGRKAAEGGAA